jgi:uncharacterized delta-60 repeat protein
LVGSQASQGLGWQVTRMSSTGVIDTTFTENSFPILPSSGALEDLAVGSDDKVTVVGSTSAGITVVRLNADGTPDNSFHVTGSEDIVIPAFCQYGCSAGGVAILADETAVLAGNANADVTNNGLVFHLLNDGTLDPNFVSPDAGGAYIAPSHSPFAKVIIDSSGRIVAAGAGNITLPVQMFAARLSASGVPDSTFGDAGVVEIKSSTGLSEQAFGIAEQRDAGYVIVGSDPTGIMSNAIGFIRENGSDAGASVVSAPFGAEQFFGVSTQDDGKIVIVGTGTQSFASESYLVRRLDIATADPTFNGDGGPVVFATGGVGTDPPALYFRHVLATHDGRILVVGEQVSTGTVVMRFWQ